MAETQELQPQKSQPQSLPEINSILPPPHPDDIRVAKEVAKGANQTPFKLALTRAFINPDPHLVNAALSVRSDLPLPYRLTILALTFENLAKEYEENSRIKEGMEAREKAKMLIEEARKLFDQK